MIKKITDKLTKKQVLNIPKLLEKKSIGELAKNYNVSWQAVWYHIKKLRKCGIKVVTRKRGSITKIYNFYEK